MFDNADIHTPIIVMTNLKKKTVVRGRDLHLKSQDELKLLIEITKQLRKPADK